MPSSRSERKKRWRFLALLGCLILGTLTSARGADRGQHQLRLTAFAVNLGATPELRRMGPSTQIVDITIDRWSTDQERDELLATLKSKGPDALLTALRENPPAGTIRTPDTVAWDLHFARERATEDGGRRIFLATDRPIRFWEAANLTRSIHYPFTLLEIRLDKNGHGEGKLSVATKIEVSRDGKDIELEDYATQPVLLQDVHEQR
jgi:hypothetical protein